MRVRINGFTIIKSFNLYMVYKGHNLIKTVNTYREAFKIAGGL